MVDILGIAARVRSVADPLIAASKQISNVFRTVSEMQGVDTGLSVVMKLPAVSAKEGSRLDGAVGEQALSSYWRGLHS